MVVTDSGRFVTQRDVARLALVRTALEADGLRLVAPGAATLRLPFGDMSGGRRTVRVWRDDVEAVDAGADAARWISRAIGQYSKAPQHMRKTGGAESASET